MMNQIEFARNAVTICPVCNQEGRRITCSTGGKSEVIFYHPERISRTICRVAEDRTEGKSEVNEEEAVGHNEADTVEGRRRGVPHGQ
jgi:hypothetical protein